MTEEVQEPKSVLKHKVHQAKASFENRITKYTLKTQLEIETLNKMSSKEIADTYKLPHNYAKLQQFYMYDDGRPVNHFVKTTLLAKLNQKEFDSLQKSLAKEKSGKVEVSREDILNPN